MWPTSTRRSRGPDAVRARSTAPSRSARSGSHATDRSDTMGRLRESATTAGAVDHAYNAAERAARESYGRLLALLAVRTRDVAGAEDALADAFAAALKTWPDRGVPANPVAWLLTAARHRQTDAARRRQTQALGEEHLQLMADEHESRSPDAIPDRRLALMFACAHPAIAADMRAPMILQTILGLTGEAIAAAFLVPPATMGQRLVRTKARIRQAGIPFQVPDRDAL